MSALGTRPPAVEEDDEVFNASAYDLPVPRMDGRTATKLNIRFSGSGVLDRTSEDDLELLKAMRLGEPVRLIVVGSIGGKAFSLGGSDDEELVFACSVRVASVEAGEIA